MRMNFQFTACRMPIEKPVVGIFIRKNESQIGNQPIENQEQKNSTNK